VEEIKKHRGRPKKEAGEVLDLQLEAKKEILNRCYRDLLEFGKTIAPNWFYLSSPEFHKEVTSLLMDRSIDQLCIQAPRGFAKSTFAILFVLHHCLFDDGDKVVIIQSKTRDEAINRLKSIQDILDYSTAFRNLFGYAGREVAQTWRENKIKTTLGGRTITIRAIGTMQPARGTLESGTTQDEYGEIRVESTRITLFYLDDPDDEDNTKTKETMDANYSKFAGIKEGIDKRLGRVLVVGTPVRQGCIVDKLYDSIGWVSKHYTARWEENGEKKLLWEEMRNWDYLENKKKEYEEQGKISKYYSEYECKIVGEEDQLFKAEYIQKYSGTIEHIGSEAFLRIDKLNGSELQETRPVNIFIGIDPASSTKQTADYSVTMPIAYDKDGNIFILPYFRKRVTPTAHAEQIIDLIKRLKPARGFVESVGYQEMLRQYLRQRLEEEGLYLPGLEKKYNPKTEKSARLETLHPFFYNKKIYFQEGMEDFLDELLMYPRGKHDDTIDGFYYATRGLYKPDHTIQSNEDDDMKYFLRNTKNTKGWLAA
jgi:predicted phage terminase large subunit-like protein